MRSLNKATPEVSAKILLPESLTQSRLPTCHFTYQLPLDVHALPSPIPNRPAIPIATVTMT